MIGLFRGQDDMTAVLDAQSSRASNNRGSSLERYVKAVALVILTAVNLVGCASVPDKPWKVAFTESPNNSDPEGQIRILQIDEGVAESRDGRFFPKQNIATIYQWLDQGSSQDPIVVFVHGWHHNANAGDANLHGFRKFIEHFQNDLDAFVPVALNESHPRVKGLYIGWRGDSLNPVIGRNTLDFLTVWGRKNASSRVGKGDLRALMLDFEKRYQNRPVVFIGHSLGGNALARAWMEAGGISPAAEHEYILINPAISSSEFKNIERLVEQAISNRVERFVPVEDIQGRIRERLYRKMIVIQSLGDAAVGKLYPLAFGEKAVGFDRSRWTYAASIDKAQASCPPIERTMPTLATDYCRLSLSRSAFTLTAANADTPSECERQFALPVWIIGGADSVSKSHGDILNTAQGCALAEWMARWTAELPGY